MTIEDLAVMVQGGFSDADKRFDGVDARLLRIEGRLEVIEDEIIDIKRSLETVIYRQEFEFLKERVEQVEKILQVLAKKSH